MKTKENICEALYVALRLVALTTQVSIPSLNGDSRKRPVARARQMVMYLLRRRGYSGDAIGQLMHRDRKSIDHGCYEIDRIRNENPSFSQLVMSLERVLKQALLCHLEGVPVDVSKSGP